MFKHVTYSQKDKLLISKHSLSTVCESLTLQEAEMRIIQEGEEIFNLSQGEEALSLADPITSTNNTINQLNLFHSSNAQANTGTADHLPGIISTEG